MSAPIWIAADAADARRFQTDGRRGVPVMGLTPAARVALVQGAADPIDPRRNFTDWAQARTVAAVRRARLKLVAAAAVLPGARVTHREIAIDYFLRAASTGYRLWFTLGPTGPWMVPQAQGWLRCATRDAAYAALLRHMLAPLVAAQAGVARVRMPPVPAAYRALRNLVLRAACRNRTVFVSGARKGMFGLLDAVAAEATPARIVVVQPADGGWRDYLRLARNAWRVLRGERFLDAALLAPPQGDALAAADRLIAAVDDRVISSAFSFYRTLLAYRLAQVEPAFIDARAIVAAASPRHYLSADASRLSDLALAEGCGHAAVTRWVLSRNTHVPPASRLALEGCQGYFSERQPADLVDAYLFWSSHGAAAARSLLPPAQWDRIQAIQAVPVAPQRAATRSEGRHVLAADSFAAYWYLHYWIYQTSDEFVAAYADLARAVEAINDARLTIRMKVKSELDVDSLKTLLPTSSRLTVKARGNPIIEDILAADVVVAFRSTTIEEALHARRPVLLWGASNRYRYLPARTEPPRPGDRAALYSARTPEELGVMLRAILDCHAGAPLTDAELAGHVWPADTPGIQDFARRMLNPDAAPQRSDLAYTSDGRRINEPSRSRR